MIIGVWLLDTPAAGPMAVRGSLLRTGGYVLGAGLRLMSAAVVARHLGVADFGRFHITGYLAWWTWLFVHLLYLVGFRNRLSVLVQWAYAYFTFQRGARLISEPRPPAARTPVAAAAAPQQTGSRPLPAPPPPPPQQPQPAAPSTVPAGVAAAGLEVPR